MAAIDADDLVEALADITPVRASRGFTPRATPDDDDVRSAGRRIRRFLAELPGAVTISELREALEEALVTDGGGGR